jgi:hypothetical protein
LFMSSLIFFIIIFNLFLSIFIVSSVSLWCLFRVPLSSFVYFCLLMFFIFGVLKFLECILYIFVNCF